MANRQLSRSSKQSSSSQEPNIKLVNIKKEEVDDDDIVFIEEVAPEPINKKKKNDEPIKSEDSDPNEFIFNYTQENEDIDFDSDDELISVFNLHQTSNKAVNKDIVNYDKKTIIEDDEDDDDIKFILNDNNAFFSKIDSMLIDLTKDDEDENKIVNNGKTSFYISFKDILLNESFIF